MQTYDERAAQLGSEASISVTVLLGTDPTDGEFLPLTPKMADDAMLAQLRERWHGRGLHVAGVIGLCGATPRVVLREELDSRTMTALAGAFLTYLNVVLAEGFVSTEIAELERMYALPDTRD